VTEPRTPKRGAACSIFLKKILRLTLARKSTKKGDTEVPPLFKKEKEL